MDMIEEDESSFGTKGARCEIDAILAKGQKRTAPNRVNSKDTKKLTWMIDYST
jgi:hypothetical protein